MTTNSTTFRLLILAVAFGAIASVYSLFVRPAYMNWGATVEERLRPLAGDDIVPNAAGQETRAISIQAPVDKVWPWLAQVGQDRGGFYSFDLLENVIGCNMPTVDVLRREKQAWNLGDKLWMYPSNKAGGVGFATLRVLEPGLALGFGTRMIGTSLDEPENGSWSWALEPAGGDATRLLIRGRGSLRSSWFGVAVDRAFFEPVHFLMERRMMIGLKQVVETGSRDRTLNNVHIALWVITFTLMMASAVSVVRRADWVRPLGAFVFAAAVFQVLTLMQPPIAVGLLLVVVTAATLRQPGRPVPRSLLHADEDAGVGVSWP